MSAVVKPISDSPFAWTARYTSPRRLRTGVTPEIVENLVEEARKAALLSYCPYSHRPSGAAVLTESGEIFTGCTVENSSLGLTCCAERNAIYKAVSVVGTPKLTVVVVFTPTATAIPPCGACRQVIAEFGPHAMIVSACDGPTGTQSTLDKLLPGAF